MRHTVGLKRKHRILVTTVGDVQMANVTNQHYMTSVSNSSLTSQISSLFSSILETAISARRVATVKCNKSDPMANRTILIQATLHTAHTHDCTVCIVRITSPHSTDISSNSHIALPPLPLIPAMIINCPIE